MDLSAIKKNSLLPCVIHIYKKEGQVYGSEKNKNQGIEMVFEELSQLQNKDTVPRHSLLRYLRIKGFVEDYTIAPDSIQRVMCRFLCEGKCTLLLFDHTKILISKISEALFYKLIQFLVQVNPRLEILGLPDNSFAASLSNGSCVKNKDSMFKGIPHDVSVFSGAVVEKHHRSLRQDKSLGVSTTFQKTKRLKSSSRVSKTSLFEALRTDLLTAIFYDFDVINEMLACSRVSCDLIRRRRHVLRTRSTPYGAHQEDPRCCLAPSSNWFSHEQLKEALSNSPNLRVLDCSQGMLFTMNDLDQLFLQGGGLRVIQLEGLSLRCHGRVSDSLLRQLLSKHFRLKRLNLINVSCNYHAVLEPFFSESYRHRPLEFLWIGKMSTSSTVVTSVCLTCHDDTLVRLFGSASMPHDEMTCESFHQYSSLISLGLPNCGKIQKPLALRHSGKTLIELDLRGTSITDDVGFELFKSLPHLRYLNLSSTFVGDRTLKTLLLSCPSLFKLDVSNLKYMAQEDPLLLRSICTSWPHMECLNLSGNSHFSGNIMPSLIQHPKLLSLNLSRCLHLLPEHFVLTNRTNSEKMSRRRHSLQLFVKDSSLNRRSLDAILHPYNIMVYDSFEKREFDVPHVPLLAD